MKQLLILISLVAFSYSSFSQQIEKPAKKSRKEEKRDRLNAQIKAEEEGIIAYRKHFAIGVKLITDGWGITFEKGYSKSVKRATLFQFEFSERKHVKEERISSTSSGPSYYYGKINFFYPVKLGVQKQFLLGNKSNKNGVSITANVGGGLSLGLLRAYELEVVKNGVATYIRYDSEDSILFKTGNITNAPGLGKGWDHMKLTPGLYIKPGLRFDYGKYNDLVSAIEVGVAVDFYSKKIPQLFDLKQQQVFFGAYFNIMFGKRK
jgi:hypothetical protein